MRIAAAILMLAPPAFAQSTPQAGDTYEITRSYQTTSETSEGGSSSSRGHTAIVERVVATHGDGIELEYDLPPSATAEDRAREWQFPVRVLKPASGPVQLRNRLEIEARIAVWLKATGLTRADCGRWIFTWNAFRIECDPEAALTTIESYDLRSIALHEGASYQEPGTLGPGTLTRTASGPDGATFTATLQIDPDAVRRSRAESDRVVGEITRTPVTLDAALQKRAQEQVSGTVSVTLETDTTGGLRRRTTITTLETKRVNGETERETRTEITERRKIAVLSGG
ncbi:hypothetical protein OK349_11785 [Sphingomonas sp. BT-65]|uniref:hypothetical protein n=1 Tax=Sphingomonas sp. BT-65 TaxID=2989821 RepID=UPI002235E5D8|nr:hypothetical protein [Sphingomonas sp. BT-65]MCW4462389.1 hypothetical protein [Sphingomonas sp. BT-65]